METTKRPIIVKNPSSAGAGLIMTLLERYVNKAPNRSRRELTLAAGIDAYEGGRARLEEAVRKYRSMPLSERVQLVGQAFATLDTNAPIDDSVLSKQVKTAFRTQLAEVGQGLFVRQQTALITPLGAPAFTVPEEDLDGLGSRKKVKTGSEAADEVPEAFRQPGPVIGKMPKAPVGEVALNALLYQVEFAGIYCQRETSWDQGSSHDEVYTCMSMMADGGHNWSRRSVVYSKLDSGDSRGEEPKPCLLYGPAPIPAETLWISTLMMEYDFGNPNEINKLWHDAATVGACIAKYYGIEFDAAVTDSVANLLNKLFGLGDDSFGWDNAMLHPSAFDYYANQPLLHFKGLTYHFFTFHTDNDAKYYTFYRVRRVG